MGIDIGGMVIACGDVVDEFVGGGCESGGNSGGGSRFMCGNLYRWTNWNEEDVKNILICELWENTKHARQLSALLIECVAEGVG